MRVTQQPESRDVRDRTRLERSKHLGGIPVQLDHRRDRGVEGTRRGGAVPLRLQHDAGAEGLREEENVARRGSRLRPDPVGMHRADDREPVLRLRVADRVPAREDRPGRAHALVGAREDVREQLDRKLFRERGDGEREQRQPAHGEDVVQGVRRGDRAERPRVVHEGWEEVDREDDGPVRVEPVDRRVVRRVETDEEVLRVRGDDSGEQRLEASGRVLRRAATRSRERGEGDRLHGEQYGLAGGKPESWGKRCFPRVPPFLAQRQIERDEPAGE